MFEEGQLYSPVSAGKDGQVTVHLADDHPGAGDPDYQARRNEIAALALAWKPGEPAPPVRYSDAEQEVWRTVARELAPKHDRLAIDEFRMPRSTFLPPGVPAAAQAYWTEVMRKVSETPEWQDYVTRTSQSSTFMAPDALRALMQKEEAAAREVYAAEGWLVN